MSATVIVPELKLNLVVIGGTCVGKTCLRLQFFEGSSMKHTSPMDMFSAASLTIFTTPADSPRTVRLQMWDTAGQERLGFAGVTTMLRRMQGLILVFDLFQQGSFESLDRWIRDIHTIDESIFVALVGNKCDLTGDRAVSRTEAEEFAAKHGMPYFEVSARTGENVESSIMEIARLAFDKSSHEVKSNHVDALCQASSTTAAQQKNVDLSIDTVDEVPIPMVDVTDCTNDPLLQGVDCTSLPYAVVAHRHASFCIPVVNVIPYATLLEQQPVIAVVDGQMLYLYKNKASDRPEVSLHCRQWSSTASPSNLFGVCLIAKEGSQQLLFVCKYVEAKIRLLNALEGARAPPVLLEDSDAKDGLNIHNSKTATLTIVKSRSGAIRMQFQRKKYLKLWSYHAGSVTLDGNPPPYMLLIYDACRSFAVVHARTMAPHVIFCAKPDAASTTMASLLVVLKRFFPSTRTLDLEHGGISSEASSPTTATSFNEYFLQGIVRRLKDNCQRLVISTPRTFATILAGALTDKGRLISLVLRGELWDARQCASIVLSFQQYPYLNSIDICATFGDVSTAAVFIKCYASGCLPSLVELAVSNNPVLFQDTSSSMVLMAAVARSKVAVFRAMGCQVTDTAARCLLQETPPSKPVVEVNLAFNRCSDALCDAVVAFVGAHTATLQCLSLLRNNLTPNGGDALVRGLSVLRMHPDRQSQQPPLQVDVDGNHLGHSQVARMEAICATLSGRMPASSSSPATPTTAASSNVQTAEQEASQSLSGLGSSLSPASSPAAIGRQRSSLSLATPTSASTLANGTPTVGPNSPASVSFGSVAKRPSIFISFRFEEAVAEARLLKQALQDAGVAVFVCDVNAGKDILKEIAQNLAKCDLAVILGTATYGTDTGCGFSTYDELRVIKAERKPFFLFKMCDMFAVDETRFHLPASVSFLSWQPGSPLPSGAVESILARLNDVAVAPST